MPIVTVTDARQFLPFLLAVPLMPVTVTYCAGSPGVELSSNAYASRLGEPVPIELIRPLVALLLRREATVAGDAAGFAASANTATPATWGDAIEVPLMVLLAVSLLFQADVMALPGAKM